MNIEALRKELLLAPMKSHFSFTRDEVIELLGGSVKLLEGARADKPFLLFQFLSMSPSGGWEDFQGRFATLEEARAVVADAPYGVAQIVYDGVIVESYYQGELRK